ncbi:MAG: SRPBCC domain-containing protein [Planctomycetota bacterium]
MDPKDPPVIVEQHYPVSPDRLWRSITEAGEMRAWFFDQIDDFQAVDGFETTFVVELDEKKYVHRWRISGVKPSEQIVYDWSYDGLPGRGMVTWKIAATEEGSRLELTNEILEAFPDDDPAFTRESCVNGWTYFLQESLKLYLEDSVDEVA